MHNFCFLRVCWNLFGVDVVVVTQKGYHEAVEKKCDASIIQL